MTARTLAGRGLCALLCLAPWLAGCGMSSRHAARQIPQLGIIDPHQPKELEMVSMPPYVVEPPDELEISVRPTPAAMANQTTFVVRSDGNIDLGFAGDVYVAGLTLSQVEQKVAQHLEAVSASRGERTRERIEASARLVNGSQSKFYYVLGTVSNQGRFPITGNETVLDGILAAGLRSNSLPEKSYLVRPHPNGGADQVYRIDWDGIKLRGDTLTNYQLFPGDRIVVPGGKAPSLLSTLVGGG
jgi:polysaccharide export outer membrane protein